MSPLRGTELQSGRSDLPHPRGRSVSYSFRCAALSDEFLHGADEIARPGMLFRRFVQFSVNVCGTILLLFVFATFGLMLMLVAVMRHLH